MTMRNVMLVTTALLAASGAAAQAAGRGIDARRHPDLAAAQDDIRQASEKITDAQQAKGYAVGGHAAKAKRLLAETSAELKEAALAANRRQVAAAFVEQTRLSGGFD